MGGLTGRSKFGSHFEAPHLAHICMRGDTSAVAVLIPASGVSKKFDRSHIVKRAEVQEEGNEDPEHRKLTRLCLPGTIGRSIVDLLEGSVL